MIGPIDTSSSDAGWSWRACVQWIVRKKKGVTEKSLKQETQYFPVNFQVVSLTYLDMQDDAWKQKLSEIKMYKKSKELSSHFSVDVYI